MSAARFDDRALLETLDWDDDAASAWLADAVDPGARSLGRRDAALLRLHRERFGDRIRCAGECPGCAATVELEVPVAELVPPPFLESGLRVAVGGVEVRFRLPGPDDVLAATDEADLARRCVLSARTRAGAAVEPASLGPRVLAAMDAAMERFHPAGGLWIDITCTACGTCWRSPMDVARFIVARARVDALRLLDDVHALATAYGWTEAEVLDVPRLRRRRYLELVRA